MATLLVVDDEEANRALILAYLAPSGHRLVEASSGDEALSMVAADPPDLVLLDVLMPGIDGFAVTERLKQMTQGAFLPVVLVTALGDAASRRRGLRAGADDVLTRPFDVQELELRIGHLLELRRKEQALEESNQAHIELHRFKDDMVTLLVHDLKSPLAAIRAGIAFALDEEAGASAAERREALEDAAAAAARMESLLHNLLDTHRIEVGRLTIVRGPIDLSGLLADACAARRWQARARDVALESAIDAGVHTQGDVALVSRVLDNVLDNAIRHTPPGGRIRVAAEQATGGRARISIGDSGAPIPREQRAALFEKYASARPGQRRMNLGLGLYFCRLAVEAHGGRIWVDETDALPTVFLIEI